MAQAEQYFAADPQSKDVRKRLHVVLRGNEADVEVSNGVFSGNRVDLGTSVLLRQAPEPPEEGTFLDLGCGWGPIALALGFASPKADIWALDVNPSAGRYRYSSGCRPAQTGPPRRRPPAAGRICAAARRGPP